MHLLGGTRRDSGGYAVVTDDPDEMRRVLHKP
jgi:hypothetical protein